MAGHAEGWCMSRVHALRSTARHHDELGEDERGKSDADHVDQPRLEEDHISQHDDLAR